MYIYCKIGEQKDQYCPRKAEKSRFSTAYIHLVCEPFTYICFEGLTYYLKITIKPHQT